MPSSYVSAQASGIVAGATDQTAAINSLLSNPSYNGLILDVIGGITINGTVNAAGKTILYYAGSYFTGSGTIDAQQIDAGYEQQLFSTTITLTNATTTTKMFSVMWFGAAGTGSVNDQPAFQRSSDTVISNTTMTRDVYFPPGIYKIDSPLILYKWSGTKYDQFTINLIGDYSVQNSNFMGFARIRPTFNDTFAIGIQRATCGMINGLSIEGTFTYSSTFDTFINTPFSSIAGHPRDTRYSPNAGIVIDPFSNGQSLPVPTDTYPGLTTWYRGDLSGGGTTGFNISNCNIQGFTIGVCNSPNGITQQGEDCVIEDCQINYVNVAIAYCQSQSDNCFIRNLRCWYWVWTVVDGRSYGARQGQVANIDRTNFAGIVNRLFNVSPQKGFTFSNVYAESFFTIGYVEVVSGLGLITGGTFDFATSAITKLQPDFHFTFNNVEVFGCRMRYYDDAYNKRLRGATGATIFSSTTFDLPPYIIGQPDAQYPTAAFENCTFKSRQVLGMNNQMLSLTSAQFSEALYGNFKLQNGLGLDAYSATGGNPVAPAITFHYNCTNFNRMVTGFANATITPDSNRTATFTSSYYYLAQVNDIVVDYVTGTMLGRISAISSSTITISEIPINITGATYTITLVYYLTTVNPIIGDISNGSPNITNVSPIFPGYINSLSPGDRFDHPAFPKGTYIVSYNSTTRVLVMSAAANKTAIRQNFINGDPDIEVKCVLPPNHSGLNTFGTPIPAGARWVEVITSWTSSQSTPTVWYFNLGGYLNASALGLSSAYQADFNIEPQLRNNSGVIQYYNNVTGAWVNV